MDLKEGVSEKFPLERVQHLKGIPLLVHLFFDYRNLLSVAPRLWTVLNVFTQTPSPISRSGRSILTTRSVVEVLWERFVELGLFR